MHQRVIAPTVPLLVTLLLGACSGLLPVRVEQDVQLVAVEHRAGGQSVEAGAIRTAVDGNPSRSVYADAMIEADFTAENEFLVTQLTNRSDETIEIDWEHSQVVDSNNVGTPIVAAGFASALSGGRGGMPGNILRSASIRVRLARDIGDASSFGVTQPLFNVDNSTQEAAESTARGMLGKDLRIVLMMKQGGTEHEYAFIFRLSAVRVEGQPVTR